MSTSSYTTHELQSVNISRRYLELERRKHDVRKINLRWTHGAIYTGSGPPMSNNPTSSMTLLIVYLQATFSDIFMEFRLRYL
jgi:hypothetical protein